MLLYVATTERQQHVSRTASILISNGGKSQARTHTHTSKIHSRKLLPVDVHLRFLRAVCRSPSAPRRHTIQPRGRHIAEPSRETDIIRIYLYLTLSSVCVCVSSRVFSSGSYNHRRSFVRAPSPAKAFSGAKRGIGRMHQIHTRNKLKWERAISSL